MKDEMDILKELANISSSYASNALSEILGKKRVDVSVPKIEFISNRNFKEYALLKKIGVVIISELESGLDGSVIFILDEKNAFKLNELSYNLRLENENVGFVAEMGMSLIKEIGSMVTCAYINALAMMCEKVISVKVPVLVSGVLEGIINTRFFTDEDPEEKEILLVEVVFKESEDNLEGSFYMALSSEAAVEVKNIFKQILGKLE